MTSLNLQFFIWNHVISQIVEAHLVVCAVGDIRVVGLTALVVILLVDNETDAQSHIAVNLAHPLTVAPGKIVVNGDDMHALARERIEVGGEGGNKSFALTGFHLRNASLMQDDAAEYLHGKVLHAKNTPRGLAAGGKRLGKNIIESFTVRKALLKPRRFRLEFLI